MYEINGSWVIGKLDLVLNRIGRLTIDVRTTILDDLAIENVAELVFTFIGVNVHMIAGEGLCVVVTVL